MSLTIKSKQVGAMRFSLIEEADFNTGHTQISIYATSNTGVPELQKGFEINQSEIANRYFDDLVCAYGKVAK